MNNRIQFLSRGPLRPLIVLLALMAFSRGAAQSAVNPTATGNSGATSGRGSTPAPPLSDEVVTLPEFTVSSNQPDRYHPIDATSGTRIRSEIIDSPFSLTVITRELLDDLGTNSVFDAMRYTPGIAPSPNSGFSGTQDRMYVRGFQGTDKNIDFFIGGGQGNTFSQDFIDRIEVVLGPDTVLSPLGNPGGTINILLKRPKYIPERHIIATVGNYNAQKLVLDLTGPLGNSKRLAYRVITARQDTDVWGPGAVKAWNVAAMLNYKYADNTNISFKWFGNEHWRLGPPQSSDVQVTDPASIMGATIGNEPQPGSGMRYNDWNGAAPWGYANQRSNQALIQITTVLPGSISARLGVRYFRGHDHADSTFLRQSPSETFDDNTGQVIGISTIDPTTRGVTARLSYTRTYQFQAQGELAANYRVGRVSVKPQLGVMFAPSRSDSNGWQDVNIPTINLLQTNAYPVPKPAFSEFSRTNLSDNKIKQLQFYSLLGLGVWDERIQFTGGFSMLHFDLQGRSWNVGNISLPPSTSRIEGWKGSAVAGLLIKVAPNARVYYNHSTNTKPSVNNGITFWQNGNQDEFGFKAEFFERRLGVSLAHFKISQTNIITANPLFLSDPVHQPINFFSDNSSEGNELTVTGSLSKNLSVVASATVLKYRDSLGRKVLSNPDQIANLLVRYAFTTGALKNASVYLGANHIGKVPGESASGLTSAGAIRQPGFYVDAWTAFNAGASYTHGSVRYTLNLENLLDDRFFWAPGGRGGVHPYPGLNIRLTVDKTF